MRVMFVVRHNVGERLCVGLLGLESGNGGRDWSGLDETNLHPILFPSIPHGQAPTAETHELVVVWPADCAYYPLCGRDTKLVKDQRRSAQCHGHGFVEMLHGDAPFPKGCRRLAVCVCWLSPMPQLSAGSASTEA